ncbi:MAG: energy-coupling factor transporter transmembrane protein EcfT [Proteobacteria bacterium]|nr:energy-coupling factor transporter transmembrane protein EcfT [Pseudomonadota bacterium]
MRSLYLDRRTWLHDVPAWIKLAVLSTFGTGLVLIASPRLLSLTCALAVAVFWSLGPQAWRRSRAMVGLAIACSLIVGTHALLGTPMLGLTSALRILTTAVLALVLTLTTRFEDLLETLETVLRPLNHVGVPAERIALGLGLTLRFAENFYVQWQRLDDAYVLRSGSHGGICLLAPLAIRTLQTAERVADALMARLGRE